MAEAFARRDPPITGRAGSGAARSAYCLLVASLGGGKVKKEERDFVAEITSRQPVLRTVQQLTREFRRLLQARDEPQFAAWLAAVEESGLSEFQNFVRGLPRDEAAVRAAMRSDWSNGQTEGQVNRLKLLKRQMFGRAKFDLLKKRALRILTRRSPLPHRHSDMAYVLFATGRFLA